MNLLGGIRVDALSFCAVKGHWQGKPWIPSLAWCSCSRVFYRQDKPWRTIFNTRQIWCDQALFLLSLRSQCELQTRFVGSLINASTEAFCFLVLKGNFRLQQKYLGFNPDTHEISENEIRHSTDFVDIGGKSVHFSKKFVREESSVSNGLTDHQWTDDFLHWTFTNESIWI